MPRRTKADLLALVHPNTSDDVEPRDTVDVDRDSREAYGEEYPDGGPKSAKQYMYRPNRLANHGWIEGAEESHISPTRTARATLTEKGAAILAAAWDSEIWEQWNNHEIGTGEFVDRAIERFETETDGGFEHGEPINVGETESQSFTCYKCNRSWHDERITECPCCDGVWTQV